MNKIFCSILILVFTNLSFANTRFDAVFNPSIEATDVNVQPVQNKIKLNSPSNYEHYSMLIKRMTIDLSMSLMPASYVINNSIKHNGFLDLHVKANMYLRSYNRTTGIFEYLIKPDNIITISFPMSNKDIIINGTVYFNNEPFFIVKGKYNPKTDKMDALPFKNHPAPAIMKTEFGVMLRLQNDIKVSVVSNQISLSKK